MRDKNNLKRVLNHISKEDYEEWTKLYITKTFFNEFLDEILEIIEERKLGLPVDTLSDAEIASQMRALHVVELFIDNMKDAQDYETFINTFDLGEEDD